MPHRVMFFSLLALTYALSSQTKATYVTYIIHNSTTRSVTRFKAASHIVLKYDTLSIEDACYNIYVALSPPRTCFIYGPISLKVESKITCYLSVLTIPPAIILATFILQSRTYTALTNSKYPKTFLLSHIDLHRHTLPLVLVNNEDCFIKCTNIHIYNYTISHF